MFDAASLIMNQLMNERSSGAYFEFPTQHSVSGSAHAQSARCCIKNATEQIVYMGPQYNSHSTTTLKPDAHRNTRIIQGGHPWALLGK